MERKTKGKRELGEIWIWPVCDIGFRKTRNEIREEEGRPEKNRGEDGGVNPASSGGELSWVPAISQGGGRRTRIRQRGAKWTYSRQASAFTGGREKGTRNLSTKTKTTVPRNGQRTKEKCERELRATDEAQAVATEGRQRGGGRVSPLGSQKKEKEHCKTEQQYIICSPRFSSWATLPIGAGKNGRGNTKSLGGKRKSLELSSTPQKPTAQLVDSSRRSPTQRKGKIEIKTRHPWRGQERNGYSVARGGQE